MIARKVFLICMSTIIKFQAFWNSLLKKYYKYQFAECGSNVVFFPNDSKFSYPHISIGSDVCIGIRSILMATAESHIYIKDKVLIAPNVSIIAGNHSSHIIGKLMFDYTLEDKLKTDDAPITIDKDVWIGANAVILKGVKIGRGSIIAAGALVARDVPPYAIFGGNPGKVWRFRWNVEEIIRHELIAYSESERMTREELNSYQKPIF